MNQAEELRDKLIVLLQNNSIGVTYLTPLPRGGRLRGEAARQIEQTLEGLEAATPLGEEALADLIFGNGCFAVGRYDVAARVYSRILQEEPDNPAARFNLGLAHLRLKDPARAVTELTVVLEQEPEMAEALYQRGNAYDDLGNPEWAVADYAAAIESNPDYLQAHYNRGVVLARIGRHRDAVAAFDRAIELRPTLSNAYLNRGASLDELELHDRAIADYAAAIDFNPDNADAYFNRARTYYYLGAY